MYIDMAQWDIVSLLIGIVIVAVLMLGVAGLPIISVAAQAMYHLKDRSVYDKCAKQLAMLALSLGWFLTVLGGVHILWILSHTQATDTPLLASTTLWSQTQTWAWVCMACASFVISLYYILWNTLRGMPLLHQFFGLMAMFFFYLSLYMVMANIASKAAYDLGEALPTTLGEIMIPAAQSTLWNALAFVPPVALSVAGAMGALWLGMRRKRDDYGRDYYMHMYPWCVAWARNGWVVLWLMLVAFTGINLWHTHVEEGVLEKKELLDAALFLLMWVIPALLWSVVIRSGNPLRHKLTTLLGLVLSFFFVGAVYLGLIGA